MASSEPGTPVTEAGRRLVGRLQVIYPADHQRPLLERDIAIVSAIEAEAVEAERARIVAAMEGLAHVAVTGEHGPDKMVVLSDVLAIVDGAS